MILKWNKKNSKCLVANDNQMAETSEKPNVGFDFSDLFFDSKLAEKTVNNVIYKLSKSEKKKCLEFISTFPYPKISVNVVGADGIYKGVLEISKMINGDKIVQTAPPSNKHILNDNENWEEAILVILDNGMHTPPKNLNRLKNIAIIFTENEKPYRMPKNTEIWDFKAEKWRDTRDLYSSKVTARSRIKQRFETQVIFETGDHAGTNELHSYKIQLDEAFSYKEDPSSETIFIDMLIKTREDEIKKEELVDKIIKKDFEFRVLLAGIMGRQQNVLNKMEKIENLEDLDVFMSDFTKPTTGV